MDSSVSLAFSVFSNKGVYALLLGSGISRAAKIPTGWEMTLHLVRKGAQLIGEECIPDPQTWYATKYGRDPDYSELLNVLAKTPSDRVNLLTPYFDPSTEELAAGEKTPTSAHKAIARLVKGGYIRVIVTTNFDRLMERALEEVGINPAVITNADSSLGALPLAHSPCTIVKIHGDYRDTRIKNTVQELSEYDEPMNRLLDRILDEYGLVICGWSGLWDLALCKAITRAPNRRFTTYWALRGEAPAKTKELLDFRKASILPIEDADSFFADLENKVTALEKYSHPHPLSKQLAVVTLKKLLGDPNRNIEFHDLIMSETKKTIGNVSTLSMVDPTLTAERILDRMKVYEASTDILCALFANAAYWAEPKHGQVLGEAVSRLTSLKTVTGGQNHLLSLRLYPALLCIYAAGLGSIASGNYRLIRQLMVDTIIDDEGRKKPIVTGVALWSVLDDGVGKQLPGYERRHTPLSDRLCDVLRGYFEDLIPQNEAFEDAFDRFEYLQSLLFFEERVKAGEFARAPVGRFGWHNRSSDLHVSHRLKAESTKYGSVWRPIQAGLFSSPDSFSSLQKDFHEFFNKVHMF